MKRSALFVSLVVVATCAAASLAARRQSPDEGVFRSQSELVVLHVNVFDGRSDAVPGLSREAFSISEDGRPQQISFFNSTDVPVAVGLVVDNSGSMIARQKMVIAGGTAFIKASHPDDEVFTVIFNENIRFGLPTTAAFTTNPLLVQASLSRFPPGGKTALYDAVVAALDHLEEASHQKRVLIVLSDGDDNASRLTAEDMYSKAKRSNAIIYTVSNAMAGVGDLSGNRGVLRKLADYSGGLAYFPDDDKEVVESFGEIAGNIRRGYALGYVPSTSEQGGGFRRVQVRVRAPGQRNLTVRTRDGYLAPSHNGSR